MWETIAFVAFDIVAFFAVAAITYRWLFKRLFDILCSGVCIMILSPLFLVLAIRHKKLAKEGTIAVVKEKFVGKKGKIVYLRKYALRNKNALFNLYSLLDIL